MLVAGLMLASGFFVAGEFALVAVERSKVDRLAQQGDRTAQRILVSLRNLSFELSGAQLGITVTSLIVGAVAEPTMARLIQPLIERFEFIPAGSTLGISVVIALALATGVQMIFAELVPKNYAITHPYAAAVWFAIPMQFVNRLVGPLIMFLNNSANWTVRRLGIEPRDELQGVRSMEELGLMIRSSGQQGSLDAGELALLTRALSFTEKVAADAMVSRVAVNWVNADQSVEDLRRLAAETGHSRFPVRGDDTDEVLGMVHVKDTFSVAPELRATTQVRTLTQPTTRVPEAMHLEEVLTELQTAGRTLAIVVDEYGGTAGIVTMSDLVEELLGAVADEHDAPDAPAPSGNVTTVSGLSGRHDVEEAVGFLWPEGRYETLGGFLIALHGRFPGVGEVISFGDWGFEIAVMDGHRVDQVVVHRPTEVPE